MSFTAIVCVVYSLASLSLAQSFFLTAAASVVAPVTPPRSPSAPISKHSQISASANSFLRKLGQRKFSKQGRLISNAYEFDDQGYILSDASFRFTPEPTRMSSKPKTSYSDLKCTATDSQGSQAASKPHFMSELDYEALVKLGFHHFDRSLRAEYELLSLNFRSGNTNYPIKYKLEIYKETCLKSDMRNIRFIGSGSLVFGFDFMSEDLIRIEIHKIAQEFITFLHENRNDAPDSSNLVLEVACGIKLDRLNEIIDEVLFGLKHSFRTLQVDILVSTETALAV